MAWVLKNKFTFIEVEERTPSPTRPRSVPPRFKVAVESTQDRYLAEVLGHAANLQPLPAVPVATQPSPPPAAKVAETTVPEPMAAERIPGSLGHPEFCRRPCVLFARGNCQAGWDCLYCHHAEHHGTFRPTKRLREKLHRLTVPSKLLLLRNCLEVKAATMPHELPSIQALRDVIEDAWAIADQQAAADVRSLQTQLSALPTSVLLGNQVIGDLSPQLHRSIQDQFNILKLTTPAP